MIVFPEAVLTGLVNNDDPTHDLSFGIEVPGPEVQELVQLSTQTGMYIALGVLEREGKALYDTAILVTPERGVALRYRRVTPGWHGPKADPAIYRHGTGVECVQTPIGAFAFLLCGDLFDDSLVAEVRQRKPDFLLVPMARSLPDGSWDQKQWDAEKPFYFEQVRKAGVTTLLTNYLADETLGNDRSFGGAMVVLPDGTLHAEFPIGKEGMLVTSIEKP